MFRLDLDDQDPHDTRAGIVFKLDRPRQPAWFPREKVLGVPVQGHVSLPPVPREVGRPAVGGPSGWRFVLRERLLVADWAVLVAGEDEGRVSRVRRPPKGRRS